MDAAADDQPVEHGGTLPEIVPAVKLSRTLSALLESLRSVSSLLGVPFLCRRLYRSGKTCPLRIGVRTRAFT
jgi:hypothetical protein